ncbi:hypothetical protein ES705_44692 [subsurface metagenome]
MFLKPITSTVPECSPTLTESPTEIIPSKSKKAPEIISFTKDCAPKPIAKPTTPALAIIAVVSTPNSLKTITPEIK